MLIDGEDKSTWICILIFLERNTCQFEIFLFGEGIYLSFPVRMREMEKIVFLMRKGREMGFHIYKFLFLYIGKKT